MKYLTLILILVICANVSVMRAQEHEGEKHKQHEEEKHEVHQETAGHGESSEHGEFKRNAIGLSIGHTHVSNGIRDGDGKWLALPSFGITYGHFFNRKWAIGVHSEIIVEDFVVQGSGSGQSGEHKDSEGDTSVIKRGRPISIAVVGVYKVHPNVGFLAGGGMEFSEHEDFALVKLGAEFPWHFGNNWEVFGTLSADIMIDRYNSFSFGFGVAKLF